MLTTFSTSFKVATFWPELVNKKIQMVESYLKEVQYTLRDGSLIAWGTVKRQVRYLEFDGRARKVEDRIQFEVTARVVRCAASSIFALLFLSSLLPLMLRSIASFKVIVRVESCATKGFVAARLNRIKDPAIMILLCFMSC